MKCQISDADAQNSIELINDIANFVGRQKEEDIRLILENTDYEKKAARPEGYDYIWKSCLRAIGIILESGKMKYLKLIIDRCKKFQNLTDKETIVINELAQLSEDVLLTKDSKYKSVNIAKMFRLLGENDKAFDIISTLLKADDLDLQFEFELRLEIEDIYSSVKSYDIKRFNNFERLINLSADKIVILEKIMRLDTKKIEVLNLIVEAVKSDLKNPAIWDEIYEEMYDPTYYIYS